MTYGEGRKKGRRREFYAAITLYIYMHNSSTIFQHYAIEHETRAQRNYASRRGCNCLYEGDRAKVMIINPGPGIIGRLNDALFHKIFPRDVAHARPRSPITNGCVSFPRDPSSNVAALRISAANGIHLAANFPRFRKI